MYRVSGRFTIVGAGAGSPSNDFPNPRTGVRGFFQDFSGNGATPSDVAVGDYLFVILNDQTVWRWKITDITDTANHGTYNLQISIAHSGDATNFPASYLHTPIPAGVQVICGAITEDGPAIIPNTGVQGVSSLFSTGISSLNDRQGVTEAVDAVAREQLVLESDYTVLDMTGQSDSRAALQTLLNSASGTLRLPTGAILIDGDQDSNTVLTFPTNLTVLGHALGTSLLFTNPSTSAGHAPFRLSSGVSLEDLSFRWSNLTPTVKGRTGTLMLGYSLSDITLKRCKFYGSGYDGSTEGDQTYFYGAMTNLAFWDCDKVHVEDCEVYGSAGANYGIEIIGGSDHYYSQVKAQYNAADGIKMFGNVPWGIPENMRFHNCRLNYNGQTVMQGQISGTLITSTTTVTPTDGARYRVNCSSGGQSVSLNAAATGTVILIGKTIGSSTFTVKNHVNTVLYTADATYDRKVRMLTAKVASPYWDVVDYSNGEGIDCAGTNITFTDCEAHGNEGGGFQVKPSNVATAWSSSTIYAAGDLVGYGTHMYVSKSSGNQNNAPPNPTYWEVTSYNPSSDIRFLGCAANDTWSGNGFAVVNNVSPYDVSPQNIMFSGCVACGNRSSGFAFTSASGLPNSHITLMGCMARSNYGNGIYFEGGGRYIKMHACDSFGNAKDTTTPGWNLKIDGLTGVRVSDCCFSGNDPTDQILTTTAEMDDTGNARALGVYLSKYPDMKDVVMTNCRFHNHKDGYDLVFYNKIAGVEGYAAANIFDQSINADGYLEVGTVGTNSQGVFYFTGQQTASLSGTNNAVVTFDP